MYKLHTKMCDGSNASVESTLPFSQVIHFLQTLLLSTAITTYLADIIIQYSSQ